MPGPLHTWSHLILTATLGCIYYPIFKDEEIETQKKLGNLPEEPQGEGDGVELGIQICQTGNPRLFFCDSIYCSEHWLLFIYILMRYFNFTPLWGKSGTMISEDHLCLASVSLGQLAAFETTSPVKWGQSSPCGNTVMRPKGDDTYKTLGSVQGTEGAHYSASIVTLFPQAPGLPVILTFTGNRKNFQTQILIVSGILVLTAFRSISRHPMCPCSEQ